MLVRRLVAKVVCGLDPCIVPYSRLDGTKLHRSIRTAAVPVYGLDTCIVVL